jgi:hypothetical protein
MAIRSSVRTRRDRWSDWAVICLVVTALLLGWAAMTWEVGQTETFTDEDTGLTLQYPQDWLLRLDAGMLFQALDPESGEFKTRYQVRDWPIQVTDSTTPTLTMVLNNASLSRAQETTAYRLFEIVERLEIGGQPAMESSYAYVVEGSDLFVQKMPVVVQGRDVAVAAGDQAYVFSLVAARENFEGAGPAFDRFVQESVKGSALR